MFVSHIHLSHCMGNVLISLMFTNIKYHFTLPERRMESSQFQPFFNARIVRSRWKSFHGHGSNERKDTMITASLDNVASSRSCSYKLLRDSYDWLIPFHFFCAKNRLECACFASSYYTINDVYAYEYSIVNCNECVLKILSSTWKAYQNMCM